MTAKETLGRIREVGIVPVIRAESPEDASLAADAIRAGGIPVLEITMTVPGAVELIAELVRRHGADLLVGAGTVLDATTARACIQAGARFVASPALDLDTIACCRSHGVPVFPGALTPTEVVRAWQSGADMVKVFPCGSVGGPAYLRALRAPLPHIPLFPTGGVTLENAAEYVKAGAAALGLGADLVDPKALRAGRSNQVSERARQLVEIVRAARLSS